MRFPIFWVAVAYGAGLAAFADVDDSPRTLFLLATLALLAGLAALGRRWLRAAFLCVLAGFFLAGGATIGLVAAAVPPTRIDRLLSAGTMDLSEAARLTAWLRRAPEKKPFATFYELELEAVETGGRRYPASGGVRLSYFPASQRGLPPEPLGVSLQGEPPLPELRYGDRVEALVAVHRPVNRQTPGSFDWQGYQARRGIFLEGLLRDPRLLKLLPGRRGHRVFGWIQGLRTRLLEQLDTLVPPATRGDPFGQLRVAREDSTGDRNAVLRAMLLGDTGFLSHRQREPFLLSGAYHVLVVSGMQVALFAVGVWWLLGRLRSPEGLRVATTIAAVVFYLLLVEDRPPVERAVWMVSLYLVARLLFRQVHLANPTALAALVVLFLHPLWLFEGSFHLSFGAVFLMAFFALPWRERTSAPYREALGFLDAEEHDDLLRPPHLAQFRLDLRLLAAVLAGWLFWSAEKERSARRLLTSAVRLGLNAWDVFLLSLAVQLGFVLMTALYFQRVIWVGLVTNILVVPLVGWIVPLGLGGLLLSLLWLPAGALVAEATSLLTGWLLAIVEVLARFGFSYGIPPPPLWVALLYLGALGLLGVATGRGSRRLRNAGAAALAALILVVATFPFSPRVEPAGLEVTLLDVGQGDSLLVTFPNREAWLVDAGRGPVEIRPGYAVGERVGEAVITPYLRARGLKRLDRAWLTHAHADHLGGLAAVLNEFRVGSFHVGRNPETPAYRELLDAVRRRRIPLQSHQAGERFSVGSVSVEVLWPPADHKLGREPSNNDSLVLRLCLPRQGRGLPEPPASACVLLPGDIEKKAERKLLERQAPLAAVVLKVPHHGGRDAATREFLAAVGPEVALISVGANNPHGHPFEEVLARLAVEAKEIHRTDRDGSITVRLSPAGLDVHSYRQRQPRQPYPNLWARLAAGARRLAGAP